LKGNTPLRREDVDSLLHGIYSSIKCPGALVSGQIPQWTCETPVRLSCGSIVSG
jgi:hypothetical protein